MGFCRVKKGAFLFVKIRLFHSLIKSNHLCNAIGVFWLFEHFKCKDLIAFFSFEILII